MIGTMNVKGMVAFYKEVLGKNADMEEERWYGWMVGSAFLSVGQHSKMKGKAKDAGRMMFNLETKEVKKEFDRISKIKGAKVIAKPYEIGGGMIATFADPDGNYFQLMAPWDGMNNKN